MFCAAAAATLIFVSVGATFLLRYLDEKNYAEAVKGYTRALEIGPGGWHKDHCEENLKKAQELAGGENQ